MWKYNPTPLSNEFYHVGVLGMKWGVRKKVDTPNESASDGSTSGKNINSKGIDLDQLDKGLKELLGTSAGDKLARKRLKPPREAPMFKWSEEERDKFEVDYEKSQITLRKAFNIAKDTKTKTENAIESYNLEDFHQNYQGVGLI